MGSILIAINRIPKEGTSFVDLGPNHFDEIRGRVVESRFRRPA